MIKVEKAGDYPKCNGFYKWTKDKANNKPVYHHVDAQIILFRDDDESDWLIASKDKKEEYYESEKDQPIGKFHSQKENSKDKATTTKWIC